MKDATVVIVAMALEIDRNFKFSYAGCNRSIKCGPAIVVREGPTHLRTVDGKNHFHIGKAAAHIANALALDVGDQGRVAVVANNSVFGRDDDATATRTAADEASGECNKANESAPPPSGGRAA